MIQYKLDAAPVSSVNNRLSDMNGVLKEVAVTYRLLLETLADQQASISLPSIDAFRNRLQSQVDEAIDLSEVIAENAQKLVVVSDQASKHLSAFENHYSAALEKHTQEVA